MKKITVVILFVCVLSMSACAEIPHVVCETPVDCRISEAHYETSTRYVYKVDLLGSSSDLFKLVPEVYTEYVDTTYYIKYDVVYSNDKIREEWREVSKEEYQAYANEG